MLAGAAWLALLAGCGPGIGGTGSGASADEFASFGAAPASVCDAEFAGLLNCAIGTAALQGTAAVWFAESAPASRTLLALSQQEARLQLRCEGLVFEGAWGAVPGQPARYYGRVTSAGGTARASLEVALAGAALAVTLRAQDGSALAPTGQLLRVPGETAPLACP
jgi:hypothetical protein